MAKTRAESATMKIEDRIAYYVTEAKRRLTKLALPTDPVGWLAVVLEKCRTDEKLKKRYLDGTISYLYQTISAAHRALAAYRAGDWDGFAQHHETMIGQSMSARIPDLVSYMSRKAAKSQRSKDKVAAKKIYNDKKPASAKELLREMNNAGMNPNTRTVANWYTVFRKPRQTHPAK